MVEKALLILRISATIQAVHKIQLLQFLVMTVYVVWSDNTTSGNSEIFFVKSTDAGDNFTDPENISNNAGVLKIQQLQCLKIQYM